MTKKEFDLIKEVINERVYNFLRNGIYVTCSMYDELKEME